VALQFRADHNQDNFDNSILGLRQSRSQSYTIDGAFMPSTNTSLYAFYTHDRIDSDQQGRTFNAAGKLVQGTLLESPNDWFTMMEDRIDTFGVGTRISNVGRWDFGVDFSRSNGVGRINTLTGSGIAVAGVPLPDLNTRLGMLQAHAIYRLRKNVSLRLSLAHQKLRTSDWAYDFVTANTLANVLTTGQAAPNYSVNVIGISVVARYW
jgi:hypothetical protein